MKYIINKVTNIILALSHDIFFYLSPYYELYLGTLNLEALKLYNSIINMFDQ